jgi:hypothetical protein
LLSKGEGEKKTRLNNTSRLERKKETITAKTYSIIRLFSVEDEKELARESKSYLAVELFRISSPGVVPQGKGQDRRCWHVLSLIGDDS